MFILRHNCGPLRSVSKVLSISSTLSCSSISHLALAVGDGLGRLFLYRSRLTGKMMGELLPQVNGVVPTFVSAISKPFTNKDMLLNSRGEHWFSIAGHNRNNKSVSCMLLFNGVGFNHLIQSALHRGPLQQHCSSRTTPPLQSSSSKVQFFKGFRLSLFIFALACLAADHNHRAYGCEILKAHFPAIAKRYQDSINLMKEEYGIKAMFGLFFNFCLNAPREGARRVFCKPHVDWKNVAFGVCMIYVYGG